MKRTFNVLIVTVFSLAALCLIIVEVVMTSRTVAISNNMFNISVASAMDEVTGQLNRLRVEDYISQKDRYKLIKYRRIEELNEKMSMLVSENTDLFYDEARVSFGTALQDSALEQGHALSQKERETLQRYNQLLGNRNKLSQGSLFYDQFISEISNFVVDNLMSETTFNYARLDSIIGEKLLENGVDFRPDVGVLNPSDTTFLYLTDTTRRSQMLLSPYRYSFRLANSPMASEYYITLLFPKTALFFRDSMTAYILATTLLLVIIIVLFILSVRTIIKQNRLDEMKNDFVNNMTHEIKTPLSTISLACQMLQDKSITPDAEAQTMYVNMISNENHRMRMLVETILQSSKMANKNFRLNIHEVNINEVVGTVCESFMLSVSNRQGQLEQNLLASPATLYADELHITNMIYNLIDNAIKYSPAELMVKISTRSEGDRLLIEVSDHGRGISREDLGHIFEKFYRVSTGNVHDVKGFGIGLNYVQQVVALHHGTIQVSSELGQGTTFTISLPLE